MSGNAGGNTKERDISGCAASELASFFHAHKPKDVDSRSWVKTNIPEWADAGDDGRDFAKIVDQQKYDFVGLGQVDRIVTALGFNLHTLTETGVLTIVPSKTSGHVRPNALKMVKEEIAASLEGEYDMSSLSKEEEAYLISMRMREIGEEEIQARCERLRLLRETHCVRTPEQQEVLYRDGQRSMERVKRLQQAESELDAA